MSSVRVCVSWVQPLQTVRDSDQAIEAFRKMGQFNVNAMPVVTQPKTLAPRDMLTLRITPCLPCVRWQVDGKGVLVDTISVRDLRVCAHSTTNVSLVPSQTVRAFVCQRASGWRRTSSSACSTPWPRSSAPCAQSSLDRYAHNNPLRIVDIGVAFGRGVVWQSPTLPVYVTKTDSFATLLGKMEGGRLHRSIPSIVLSNSCM
jgi:hypothetical protein